MFCSILILLSRRAAFGLPSAGLSVPFALAPADMVSDGFVLILPDFMVQPFQLTSKMMPFGSLNLRSKSSGRRDRRRISSRPARSVSAAARGRRTGRRMVDPDLFEPV